MAVWIAEFVALIIIVLVLLRYVRPPVRKAMKKQQDLIRQQIEDSKAAAQRRKEAEDAYQNAVAEARVDAAKIRDDARAEAQAIEDEMRAFAEREVERIKQRGEEQLVVQREQLARELRAMIGGQANDLAGRIVRAHVADDANRSATVDRFLDELESMAAPGSAGKGEA
ncbi:MAG TPA: F0F1 ATP synthase subunit B [Amycolatopsis sp.]|jgi:ATP synthase F0 subunit b|nr:F0F1 ATP synthase subunit B [Amycolatopsis sp.]